MRAFRQKTPWIIPGFACRYLSSLSCVYPYVSECECVDAHRRRQPPLRRAVLLLHAALLRHAAVLLCSSVLRCSSTKTGGNVDYRIRGIPKTIIAWWVVCMAVGRHRRRVNARRQEHVNRVLWDVLSVEREQVVQGPFHVAPGPLPLLLRLLLNPKP